MAINNYINNKVGASNSGATNTLTIDNASNTASSVALLNITVGGTSSGDPFETFTVAGTTNWSQGIDNSASDAYVIAASTALGTTNVISASTAGEINSPLQPAFFAYLASDALNVTGAGGTYTLGGGTALTEVFDQNADFVTSGTFTAPITGRYFFTLRVYLDNVTAAMTATTQTIVTSNRSYLVAAYNTGTFDSSGTETLSGGNSLCDMDAADTTTFTCVVSNGAGNTADAIGTIGGGETNVVSGYLVC